MSNSSIWPIDRTLSYATIPDDGNKEGLWIPQSSSITWASPSVCFVSYAGHLLKGYFSSVEMQSVYSAALAD